MRFRSHMKRTASLALLSVSASAIGLGAAQTDGPDLFVITGGQVHIGNGTVIPGGSVIIEDGLITAVGENLDSPSGAWILDATGKSVYPGLINALGTIGLTAEKDSSGDDDEGFSQGPEDRPGTYSWRLAADEVQSDDERVATWREGGFTSSVTSHQKGIFPGQAAFINLAGERGREMVVATPAGLRVNFEAPGHRRAFPGSLMGILAYVRQVFADADHYRVSWEAYEASPRGKKRPEYDRTLAPLASAQSEGWPVLLPAHLDHEIRRAVALGNEMGVVPVLYGLHQGYRASGFLAEQGVSVLVSAEWPAAEEDRDPEQEEALKVLRLRDKAPSTPAELDKAGVRFGFYADGSSTPSEILEGVRKAISAGLSPESALSALTLSNAAIFGMEDRLGSLEAGKIANVVITDGDLFSETTKVSTVFVDGRKYEMRGGEDNSDGSRVTRGESR